MPVLFLGMLASSKVICAKFQQGARAAATEWRGARLRSKAIRRGPERRKGHVGPPSRGYPRPQGYARWPHVALPPPECLSPVELEGSHACKRTFSAPEAPPRIAQSPARQKQPWSPNLSGLDGHPSLDAARGGGAQTPSPLLRAVSLRTGFLFHLPGGPRSDGSARQCSAPRRSRRAPGRRRRRPLEPSTEPRGGARRRGIASPASLAAGASRRASPASRATPGRLPGLPR